MRYQILDHPSDLKIKAFGKTKEELFENAMLGMFEGANYEKEKESQAKEVKIEIVSFDLSSLLVDFLNEILYLAETKKLVFEKVNFEEFGDTKIKAKLIGKNLKRMGVHIKAVTYFDLELCQKKDFWEATILCDI